MAWTTQGLNYLLNVCIVNTATRGRIRGNTVLDGAPTSGIELNTQTCSWGSESSAQVSLSPSIVFDVGVGVGSSDSTTVNLFQLLASDETTVLFEGSVSPNIVYETTGQLKADVTVSYSQSNTITE